MSNTSTASFRLIAGALAARGKNILLTASVEFGMGSGNNAGAGIYCADPRSTMVICMHLFTGYYVCNCRPVDLMFLLLLLLPFSG